MKNLFIFKFTILIGSVFGQTAPGVLLFNSGFEGSTLISQLGKVTDSITGVDTSVAAPNNWTALAKLPFVTQDFLNYENGTYADRKASIIPDPTKTNSANHVLQYKIYEPAIYNPFPYKANGVWFYKKARIQWNFNVQGLTEYYQSVRIFFPSDWTKLVNSQVPIPGDWINIFESWHTTTLNWFRVGLGLTKPNVSNRTGLPFYFSSTGQISDLDANGKQNGSFKTVWEYVNFTYPIPIGEWLTLDYYIKEGNKGNGRWYVSVKPDNGPRTVLFDYNVDTLHPNETIFKGQLQTAPFKLYTSDNVVNTINSKNGTLAVLWDDFKLWQNRIP